MGGGGGGGSEAVWKFSENSSNMVRVVFPNCCALIFFFKVSFEKHPSVHYKYPYSNNHTTTNIVISPLFDRPTQSRAPQYKVVTCAESLNEVGTCGESTLCSKLPHCSDALVLMWQQQSAGGPELPAGGGSHISCSLPPPWGPPRHCL